MDVLQEWLSSTIQKDLGKVLEHATQQAQLINRQEKCFYEDDGSNLRSKCSKPGLVQISKVCPISPFILLPFSMCLFLKSLIIHLHCDLIVKCSV